MSVDLDIYKSVIHKSRYARYIDSKKRRESWPETVNRYMTFLDSHLEKKHGYLIPAELRVELEQAILDMSIMPSMRAMMTAGPALERDNVAGYNPVIGSTLVVTKDNGNMPIRELVDTTQTVLNINKEWVDGTFKSYGVQPTVNVHLRLNSNSKRVVTCTENHRWVLEDGTVVPTAELKAGDKIPFASASKPPIDSDYVLGVRHGIIYGDGTATKSCGRVKGYHIRLCGTSAELLDYFKEYPVTYPPSANGDPVVMLYDGFAATHSLKTLPSNDESPSYLLGFIRGWLAADGSVTKTSQASLCVAEEGLTWLERYSERLGFVIQRVYKQSAETNYGQRRADSYVVYFSRSSLVEQDFLCSWKAANFKPLESHFVVTSIEQTGTREEVFCAEVPDTNTFTIAGGLVTGNCSYLPVDDPKSFDEAMYILLCGTGVGFSVESKYVSKLPEVPALLFDSDTTISVADSKAGWAKSFRQLLALLWSGEVPKWDVSKVRHKGARLKTFGGRASGPEPLVDLFQYTISKFRGAVGRKLTSLECHDIMCKVGEVVVVGGVRRSAMISLSDLNDDRMRHAKMGQWYEREGQRALANNSATYNTRPTVGEFMSEWLSLYQSYSGERGIFNREAAIIQAGKNGRRDTGFDFGTNPCSEIILRPYQFCNLTEVVARAEDTRDSIKRKVRLATILGTFQSTLTDFPYLRRIWTKNTEDERLLGVSITGILDCPLLNNVDDETLPEFLEELRDVSCSVNASFATSLSIPVSAAITCVKPSGTVSQLVDSASGIHARHSPYYIRRIRNDNKDPLTTFLKDSGVPHEPDVMKPNDTTVFSFPMASPEGCVTRNELDSLTHLRLWLLYQRHWCEHKPSVTIYVKEDDWPIVGAWVWEHFDEISGVSFLPWDGGSYRQAPYEEITPLQYIHLSDTMCASIDWNSFKEEDDNVEGAQTLACSAGACEI